MRARLQTLRFVRRRRTWLRGAASRQYSRAPPGGQRADEGSRIAYIVTCDVTGILPSLLTAIVSARALGSPDDRANAFVPWIRLTVHRVAPLCRFTSPLCMLLCHMRQAGGQGLLHHLPSEELEFLEALLLRSMARLGMPCRRVKRLHRLDGNFSTRD